MPTKIMSDEDWRALELQGALLLDKVAEQFGVSADDIRGKRRAENVQQARYMAAFLLDLVEFMPEDVVGRVINRSEATVIAYCEKASALLETLEGDNPIRKKALVAWAAYRRERAA